MNILKVLFLTANPESTTKLALDNEYAAVSEKISEIQGGDIIQLLLRRNLGVDDLSHLLLHHKPHIVHFSGHGSTAGRLVIHGEKTSANRELYGDPEGTAEPHIELPIDGLAGLFEKFKHHLRVVVLNACYSEAQAEAIAQSIDCAIGMSNAIRDHHAIKFAEEFYQALMFPDRSVKEACDFGTLAIKNNGYAKAAELIKIHSRVDLDPATLYLLAEQTDHPPGMLESFLPVPRRYELPREDDVRRVKQALLGNVAQAVAIAAPRQSTTISTTYAIRGMGGAGKSVLANLVARDEEVRRQFSDGILWLTVGQDGAGTEYKARELQNRLAKRLGVTLDAD